MINRIIAAGLLVLAILLAPGLAALAQTAPPATPSTTIDFMPAVVQLVFPALAIILSGVAVWGLRKFLGIQLAVKDIGVVNDVLQKGLAYATASLEKVPLKVDVKSPIIAEAAAYALAHGPDALKRVGISPAQLAEKLVARYMDPSLPVGVTEAKPVDPAASG